MAPRATWKGYLKLGELMSAVALHTAVSTSERVSLSIVNRRTGNRLLRRLVDPETGEEVPREEQVKGYEIASDEYIVLDPEEVAAAALEGDKTLNIEVFIACGDVDDLYFDRSYFLRPADEISEATFTVIRDGMRAKKVAAIASAVLYRRPRTVLIRAYDEGIIATTLNHDYEVRAAAEAFDQVKDIRIEGEMLDFARHIISTKFGTFQPEKFDDKYDGSKLYVGIGSNSNAGENGMAEEENRAAVLEIDVASDASYVFAAGLRNPVGIDWNPANRELWVSVNERDEIGDNLVPDYMTSVKEGGFYGWPYSCYGQHVDERVAPSRLELVAKAIKPDYALGSHTASLGFTFVDSSAFGERFQNGAIIGRHGSWNRSHPVGYRVIFVNR